MADPLYISTVAFDRGSGASGSVDVSITVPSNANFCVIGGTFYDGGSPTITLSGSGWLTVLASEQFSSPDWMAGYSARCSISATGSRTLAFNISEAVDEGPTGQIVFYEVENPATAELDFARDAQNAIPDTLSVTVDSETGGAVVAFLGKDINDGSDNPATPSGTTSRSFQGPVRSDYSRVVTVDSPGATTTTVTSNSLIYPTLFAVSLKAGTGGAVTHDATGTLSSPGAALSGAASSKTTRPSSGVLANPGGTIAGSANRTRVHPSSGTLANPGGDINGSAARTRVHPSSGALSGAGAALSGAASSKTTRAASGALSGAGASLAGSAERIVAGGTHNATGALLGGGGDTNGSAARTRAHPSSGVLSNPGANLSGSAARMAAAVTHVATGVLTGAGAQITGFDQRAQRRAVGFRRNYLIRGKKYYLSDYELRQVIAQMVDEVRRPEIQVVNEDEVKQISRRVWKQLKSTYANLESLTKVETEVKSNLIEVEDDDEDILMLL